jgi:hypothetical protein
LTEPAVSGAPALLLSVGNRTATILPRAIRPLRYRRSVNCREETTIMGVRILRGEADGDGHAAIMYCSTSGWSIGPIFEADDAEEQIQSFLGWMDSLAFVEKAEEIGLGHHDLPSPLGKPADPRSWPDSGLEKLVAYWRTIHVGDDGLLREESVRA